MEVFVVIICCASCPIGRATVYPLFALHPVLIPGISRKHFLSIANNFKHKIKQLPNLTTGRKAKCYCDTARKYLLRWCKQLILSKCKKHETMNRAMNFQS